MIDKAIEAATPLLTKKLIPMSAIIVAFFLLLGFFIWAGTQKVQKIEGEHHEIINSQATAATILQHLLEQQTLNTHFAWAKCINDASLIPDRFERQDALDRCIPPPNKRDEDDLTMSYLYTAPDSHRPYVARLSSVQSSSTSGSSSSADVINQRRAEEVALEQEQRRLDSLRAQGLIIPSDN